VACVSANAFEDEKHLNSGICRKAFGRGKHCQPALVGTFADSGWSDLNFDIGVPLGVTKCTNTS